MKSHKIQTSSPDRLIFYIIGGLILLALVFIGIFSLSESKQAQGAAALVSYTVNDNDKPKVEASSSFADLGNMKVKDEKTAEFTIVNKGSKPLQLFKVSSSCDCTFGQITIEGNKSPEFGMHSKNSWVGSLEPGKTAKIAVVYRPFIMPVKGVITRDVYVQTNDPQQQQLTFTVKAFVE